MSRVVTILTIASLLFWSCEKIAPDDPEQETIIEIPVVQDSTCSSHCEHANGMYVLHEGLFNMNNTSLTYIDLDSGTITKSYFESTNGRGLGDTGNDLIAYGAKGYVAVNHSNQVEVFDLKSGQSLAQIPFFAGLKGRSPRSMATYQNYVLITSFDGTLGFIDTTSLAIEQFVTVGRNPEGVCVFGDLAYVSNSGGLDAPDYDSTVSVVDLKSRTEISRINVGINLGSIFCDDEGDVYVVRRGNYQDVSSRLFRIAQGDSMAYEVGGLEVSGGVLVENTLFLTYYDFGSKTSRVSKFDVHAETVSVQNFIAENPFETLAAIAVDTASNWVYCGDAHGFSKEGEVLVFDAEGEYQYRFKSGLNPNSFAFIYNQSNSKP